MALSIMQWTVFAARNAFRAKEFKAVATDVFRVHDRFLDEWVIRTCQSDELIIYTNLDIVSVELCRNKDRDRPTVDC